MIQVEEKRLFRKNILHQVDRWDEMSPLHFLHTFFILNAPWYDSISRYEIVEWLYNQAESQSWIIDVLKVGGNNYQGPGELFRNLTMGRFMFADHYFSLYHNEHKPEDLAKFLASVYQYQPCLFQKIFHIKKDHTRIMQSLPCHVQQAVLFNYGAVRRKIMNQFPHIFPQGQPDARSGKLPLPRWDKHMWKLAAGPSDSDFKKIADSKALNILQKIDELIEESEKASRKKK